MTCLHTTGTSIHDLHQKPISISCFSVWKQQRDTGCYLCWFNIVSINISKQAALLVILWTNPLSIGLKRNSRGHSSNPNHTHLIQLIKAFRITRNLQAGVILSLLEINSAELWPSRNWVWDHCLKGLVQPQMKVLSSCTHSQVIPNFFSWTQKKIFWRMLVTKQSLVATKFHCMKKKYYGVKSYQQLAGYQHSSKYLNLLFNRRKKIIQLRE